jgi:hypothetical protein
MTEMLVPDPPLDTPTTAEGPHVSPDQAVLRSIAHGASLEPIAAEPLTPESIVAEPMATLEPIAAAPITTKPAPPAPEPVLDPAPLEDGLLAGRPVEDRAFEVVEGSLGLATGALIGGVIAGPVGAVIGGAIGAAGGMAAGEALERHEGHAAETTDADPDDQPWTEIETFEA